MDGLAALVKEQLQADPFSGVIFCFVASVPNAFAAAIPSLKADDRQVVPQAVNVLDLTTRGMLVTSAGLFHTFGCDPS
jgi:hypothetical protein